MRFLGLLIGIAAALGGSLGGFEVMRNIGPENRAGDFSAGARVPGGGNLHESAGFARVVAALKSAGGRLIYLDVDQQSANGQVLRDGQRVNLQIDGVGRIDETGSSPAAGVASMPLSRIDARAIPRMVGAARREAGNAAVKIESLYLDGGSREWRIDLEGGDVRTLVARLDGRGVRLQGEEDPSGAGSAPDSLLRTDGMRAVVAGIKREAPKASRLDGLTVYPSYAVTSVPSSATRTLQLTIGFEGELRSRSLSPRSAAPTESISLSNVRPDIVNRMLRLGRRHFKGIKLTDVMYLTSGTNGEQVTWNLYLRGSRYFQTDLGGRRLLSANP